MTHRVLSVIALAAIYVLTLASLDPLDIATGLVVGVVLTVVFAGRLDEAPRGPVPPLAQRVAGLPAFVWAVLLETAVGTWDVALRVIGLRSVAHPGVVRVPIGDRSERGVAVTTLTTTLSPGSVVIDIDWDAGDMIFHVMDASDPEAFRAHMQRFYDRYQRRVYP